MRLKEGLVLRKIGEDYVVVSPEQGMVDLSKVYSFNETAAWLWEKLNGKDFDLITMVDLIKDHYDVEYLPSDQIENDMAGLINFFEENGLLV